LFEDKELKKQRRKLQAIEQKELYNVDTKEKATIMW
jgi:hypothetical protein